VVRAAAAIADRPTKGSGVEKPVATDGGQTEAKPASGIKGFVEAVRPFQVRGWAWDPASPDDPVIVEIFVGGTLAASGPADLFRDDLLAAGFGDGRHGFVFNLDLRLSREAAASLEARARTQTGDPMDLTIIVGPDFSEAEAQSSGALAADPGIEGYFRVIEPDEVRGWAVDRRRPSDHLEIEVFLGEQRLGGTKADLSRPDLVELLGPCSDHGFVFRCDAGQTVGDGKVRVQAASALGEASLQVVRERGEIFADAETQALLGGLAFPGAATDDEQHPVFVLGAARSGTSAIAQALINATRYEGFREGHLLDLAGPLFDTISKHYAYWGNLDNTMAAAVPGGFLADGVQHILVEVARALYPAGWWLDKTPRPAMIDCAPILRRTWPRARFIFMKRRPIENLASRARKFSAQSFEAHCRDWALCMDAWSQVRDRLRGAALEIDQLTLANEPGVVAEELTSFLELSEREAEALAQALKTDQPERTAERFAATYSIEELGWSNEEQQVFEAVCGPALAEYGYGVGAEYFRPGAGGQKLMRR
jgi:hypothetical protein